MWGFPQCKYFYAIYAQMIETGVGMIFYFLFAECHLQKQECLEV